MISQEERGRLKRWRPRTDSDRSAEADQLARELGQPPVLGRLLLQRGIETREAAEAFLSPKLSHLHEPETLPGIDEASERLVRAVVAGRPIVVYGDYDVDGVCGAAILWHMLRELGADVRTYVPHRIEEGYGLNGEALEGLASGRLAGANRPPEWTGPASGEPPVICSVDCGITAVEPVRRARAAGAELIVTDHHAFDPEDLPDATLLHPRLPGSRYPWGELCGAGVALKLAWAVARRHSGVGGGRVPEAHRRLLLDLVALAGLATVADVVPLVDENRVLAAFGMGHARRTRIPGLHALIEAADIADETLDAFHAGFVLGPRLNAGGRMGSAERAVELLTVAGDEAARNIARELCEENEKRRATERQILDEAAALVEREGYDAPDSRAIVVGGEGWHPGVVGIVASRLVERYARPAVVLALRDGEAQGSARSVEDVHIHEALGACDEHLRAWGGHAMAAGMRLPRERLDAFRRDLVAHVNARLGPEDLKRLVKVDAECALREITSGLCRQIERLAPFGEGNPEPRLCLRGVTVDQPPQRVGKRGAHLQMLLRDGERRVRAVGFDMGELADRCPAGARLDVVAAPKLSRYGAAADAPRPELHLKDLRPAGDAALENA